MKYLCLIYQEENTVNAMSRQDWNAFINDCAACSQALQDSGHFIAGSALESVITATTLRKRSGRLSTTDGPFAETKEQLAGFCLIEARDLDEAIELAGRMPPARIGCVEVRPVRDITSGLPL